MGTLVKGVFIGVIGAVVLLPVALVLTLIGLPILLAGTAVVGAVLAVPLLVLAALSIPFIVLGAVAFAFVLVAAILAVKFALFVVLPIACLALAIAWLVRTVHARREAQLA
jgi:hypothetical protein